MTILLHLHTLNLDNRHGSHLLFSLPRLKFQGPVNLSRQGLAPDISAAQGARNEQLTL
jgi:hypothetical protein